MDFKNKLFSAFYCANDCADDDSLFLSPEYKKWADEFEVWLKENTEYQPWSLEFIRTDTDAHITFSLDQECYWFSDTLDVCPWIKRVIQTYIHSGSVKGGPEEFRYAP